MNRIFSANQTLLSFRHFLKFPKRINHLKNGLILQQQKYYEKDNEEEIGLKEPMYNTKNS